MLLSSGVVWRHRSLDEFRAECPAGDPALQRRVIERARRRARLARVARRAGRGAGDGESAHCRVALRHARADRRARPRGRRRPARPGCSGGPDSRDGWVRRPAGARARAAPPREPLERGRRARVRASRAAPASRPGWTSSTAATCRRPCPRSSSSAPRSSTAASRSCSTRPGASSFPASRRGREIDLVQATARCRRARRGTSSTRARCGSACASGRWPSWSRSRARPAGTCDRPDELPFELPPSPKLVEPPFVAVRVLASVTHTIGGLRIDDQARVLRAGRGARRRPLRRRRGRRRDLHRRLRRAAWRQRSSSAASRRSRG